MTTYNNLVEQIVEIAKNHPYIMHVDSGSQKENSIEDEYPLFVIQPLPATFKEYSIQFNFTMLVAEKVNQVQGDIDSNVNQTLSDTLTTLVQIINELRNNSFSNIEVVGEPALDPFDSGLVSGAVGWVATIGLIIPQSGLNCDTPIKNVRVR